MIDYFELVNTQFEDSHLIAKCKLMLLLFYLHVKETPIYDYKFLFRILWQLPQKDLLLIKKDYCTIAEKVRRGEAHLLSEGDTLYLGACRKGQKGDSPQKQPYSEIRANKRAFSLKPAYMRYILSHVTESGGNHYSNYSVPAETQYELVSQKELESKSFEQIIQGRFDAYRGLDYLQICKNLGITPYQSKSKYADVAGLIASNGKSKRLAHSDEFVKSGITMKTLRVNKKGMPEESMSFKNIDYQEIFDNDEWVDSELYELFTNRFLFVVFTPVDNTIIVHNNKTGTDSVEDAYILDKAFFWTMPTHYLQLAKEYWQNIRENVLKNNINLDAFWSIKDHQSFHVRPKARRNNDTTSNPNGGTAEKYCYWFNADFVKQIIDNSSSDV